MDTHEIGGQRAEPYIEPRAGRPLTDRALVAGWLLVDSAAAAALASMAFVRGLSSQWFLYWIVPLVFILIGVAQWLLLRTRLALGRWWLAASLLPLVIPIMRASGLAGTYSTDVVLGFMPILVTLLQWGALQPVMRSAGLWILGKLLAFATTLIVYQLLMILFNAIDESSMYFGDPLQTILHAALLGAVYGLVVGYVLMRLLGRERDAQG